MEKSYLQLKEIKLVGITVRTENANEMNPETSEILKLINKYFDEKVNEKIGNRVKPWTTYCAYTDYENAEYDRYTYFVGEEVSSFDNVDKMFDTLVIPAQNYVKFIVGPGKMPDVCVDAWRKIWKMNSNELGGTRRFATDFEIYDERAKDSSKAIFDLYLGIK